MADKPTYTIEDWRLWHDHRYGEYHLIGEYEGASVKSESLLRIDFEKGRAETSESIYKLGFIKGDPIDDLKRLLENKEKELQEARDAENRQWHQLNPERMGR